MDFVRFKIVWGVSSSEHVESVRSYTSAEIRIRCHQNPLHFPVWNDRHNTWAFGLKSAKLDTKMECRSELPKRSLIDVCIFDARTMQTLGPQIRASAVSPAIIGNAGLNRFKHPRDGRCKHRLQTVSPGIA